ncbi:MULTISPECIES: GPP34 family phosphoprotein [unclassified Plantactinospora]|uniref:GOLPH3/VPS74 family protein n=1 Tax=unclassified Plantactinospora TaxID=2631981 RepID=UPI000D15F530|nr:MULTISPECIES: GPP34 family phosphoprotein [unclassified Plantactinospora]AVT30198.1 GPP34 family phosphoprotein [Plantactinospora sp. BC1]AVT36713.1 GPP34 family phosphoprotein [Plantactinospora sp. BB1]
MTGVGLAEELLLLGYDDKSGKATGSRIGLDLGMAAAVLVDLALAGRVAFSDGSIVATDPTPTGDPIADDVLARIAADTPHTPASWVQRLRHGLRDRILSDLCTRGVISDVDETELGYIHVHRYPVLDPSVEAEIRGRLTAALTGEAVPDERTAALAAVMAAIRVQPSLGLTGPAAEDARKRLTEIARSAGFTDGGSLEESTIRPSVALVIAALSRAIDAALGSRS